MISTRSLLGLTLLLFAKPIFSILVCFVTGLGGPVSSVGIPNAKGIAAGETYVGEIGGERIRVIRLDDASEDREIQA